MYDSYRRKVGATQAQNYASNCEIASQVANDFFIQPGYAEVYKNGISSTTYDVIISEGDKTNKTVGYKMMLSYPYSSVQFSVGDYIYWNYGGEDTIWLLTSLDKQFTYSVSGRMFQCNNTLGWTVGATPHSYPCYIEDRLTMSAFDQEKNMIFANGDILVNVQKNAWTETLDIGNRFLFGSKAWKIRQVKDMTNEGIITFQMQFDFADANDTSTGAVEGPKFTW